MNGLYSEQSLGGSKRKGIKAQSDVLTNPDLIKQQTSLLEELIEVEQ